MPYGRDAMGSDWSDAQWFADPKMYNRLTMNLPLIAKHTFPKRTSNDSIYREGIFWFLFKLGSFLLAGKR